MQAKELIEQADRVIRKMFSEDGGVHEGRVWIHTKDRLISIPCKPKGSKAEMLMKAYTCAAIYATRKAGTFEGAVMIAEAWMSLVKLPQKKSYPMPALDPDRIEVAILLAYGDDGKVEARARKIEHRDGKRTIGDTYEPFNKVGMRYQSWLDAAFRDPAERGNNGNHKN
jgi:hypothetical protein